MTIAALRHAQPLDRYRAGGRRLWTRWALAWLGGPLIGIANGVTRELAYKDEVGELTAHQISTASAVALFAVYLWFLSRRWPIPTAETALAIGALWVVLTVGFEFGFGHYVDGKTWSELLGDYNVAKGHLWPLVLAWLGIGPLVMRKLVTPRGKGRLA